MPWDWDASEVGMHACACEAGVNIGTTSTNDRIYRVVFCAWNRSRVQVDQVREVRGRTCGFYTSSPSFNCADAMLTSLFYSEWKNVMTNMLNVKN